MRGLKLLTLCTPLCYLVENNITDVGVISIARSLPRLLELSLSTPTLTQTPMPSPTWALWLLLSASCSYGSYG